MNGDAHAQLAAEHEALIQFLYLAPVGLVQTGIDGEIVMINPISAQLLMPLSRDGTLTNLFTALEDVAPELRRLCTTFPRPSGMVCDGLHIHLNSGAPGKRMRVPHVLSLSLLKLDGSRLMAVLQDVSEQVRRDRQLRQSDAWLNALLTSISDYALVGLDRQGRVSDWNETIGRVTGFTPSVVGRPYSVFYPEDSSTPERVHDRLREADANGWSLEEGPRLRADGSQFWGSAMISPLPDRDPDACDDGEPAYCLVLRDISDKREAIAQRRKSVFCDELTGVANRRAFFEAAELELTRNRRTPRPTALILFDADHFKQINDRYGHPAGDCVLRQLGAALSMTFRQVDVVARVGGEEFAVLLPSSTMDGAAVVAERLRQLVAGQPAVCDGVAIAYTVSAGIAAIDEGEPLDLDTLIKRADRALYAAKANGRNRVECWNGEPDAA
ncbi:diguanylate cyclase [Massilia sp. WF1]|uniref:sensor domain-containing diguanylate cyclase n=1 Tax=unclassified Massilia TaxID=2609279 RepID=UPI0006497DA8|nr:MULTISPECIES: sensor domain-containing diguanylate cyclase [unclassified Massilia]ALK96912.1 diguanylate cyclase [Massilia sp. WG5]KLU37978.1 diguanylate cyclase [Massilia sp. WF1]